MLYLKSNCICLILCFSQFYFSFIFFDKKEISVTLVTYFPKKQSYLCGTYFRFHIMKIEQIYTGCLAQGAYYITSNGEAAIIDPLREIQPYLDRLDRDQVKL